MVGGFVSVTVRTLAPSKSPVQKQLPNGHVTVTFAKRPWLPRAGGVGERGAPRSVKLGP